MAHLHTALQSLSPTPFSSVPTDPLEITSYLEHIFRDARTVIDSVPLPEPAADAALPPPATGRPRSATTASVASNLSEISASSARSEPLDPANVVLQKEWGKPVKVSTTKENGRLGISVYKMGGKDGRGSWFARRSVHEGMSFKRWKLAMQSEFPESLKVQGGPGEGNVRGIGGERRVESRVVDGVGAVEVYHLSAQFPGPTTPRDFVTLLLTSSSALVNSAAEGAPESRLSRFANTPKHFIVVSRPCDHLECPTRDGFVRGQYESVEFIRVIPRPKPRKSLSATDLRRFQNSDAGSSSMDKEAILRNAAQKSQPPANGLPNGGHSDPNSLGDASGGKDLRQRGKTISFAESRGSTARGERVDTAVAEEEDDENDPVEWIMVTRSDPGGGIPRFMVDRGTPGSIVADAGKFLTWASKKEHAQDDIADTGGDADEPVAPRHRPGLDAFETNGHLAGLKEEPNEVKIKADTDSAKSAPAVTQTAPLDPEPAPAVESSGIFTSVAHAAYASIETYAPQMLLDRLPGHQHAMSGSMTSTRESVPADRSPTPTRSISTSSVSSVGSFASAEEIMGGGSGNPRPRPPDGTQKNDTSTLSANGSDPAAAKDALPPTAAHEKELAKLNARKAQLDAKLTKTLEKESGGGSIKDPAERTEKESERMRKAEEKHAAEVAKHEDRYRREIARLDAKRDKEARKAAERAERQRRSDELQEARADLAAARASLDLLRRERDDLRDQVGALQSENTLLVARVGQMDKGPQVLRDVMQAETQVSGGAGGDRKRSGSLIRRTVLGPASVSTPPLAAEGNGRADGKAVATATTASVPVADNGLKQKTSGSGG